MGTLRLALFWLGRDDVGGARLTWRSDASTSALTLLIGSDPHRAPRNLNQWAYLREEVRSDQAEVFSLRSLDRDQGAPPAGFGVGDGPMFGVSCSSIEEHDVSSAHTTIDARGITYRMVPRCASINRFAVGRPRPDPRALVVKNGVKIRSRTSDGAQAVVRLRRSV